MGKARFTYLADYPRRGNPELLPGAVASGLPPDTTQRTSRDNARPPVQWEATASGGFTSGTPWTGLAPDVERVNVTEQRDGPMSVLAQVPPPGPLRHKVPTRRSSYSDSYLNDNWILVR